jgi:hypothetical protein
MNDSADLDRKRRLLQLAQCSLKRGFPKRKKKETVFPNVSRDLIGREKKNLSE